MSPISPRELSRIVESELHGLVPKDLRCARCSYELQGLRYGTKCPECGTRIKTTAESLRFADNLTDAPTDYLRGLRWGVLLMCIGLGGMLVGAGVAFFFRPALGLVAIVCSSVWAWGVWLATRPRRSDGAARVNLELEWWWTRLVARVTQLAWVLWALAGVAYALTKAGGPSPLSAVSAIAFFVGFAGLWPLAVLLADLADWAQDTGLANRLRGSVWMAVGAVLLVLFGDYVMPLITLGALGSIVATMAMLVGIAGVVLFVVSIVQLGSVCKWAIRNAEDAAGRDERLKARAERLRRIAEAGGASGPRPGAAEEPRRRGPTMR